MGRKPKASKSQIMKEAMAPKPPLDAGNLYNIEHGAPLSGKCKSKTSQVFTRRSQRVQPNSVNHQIIKEHDKDKEDETRLIQEVEPNKSCGGSFKVDVQDPAANQVVLQSVEENDETPVIELDKSLQKISDEAHQNSEEETLGGTDFKYKTMYINSQRKIESLMEENTELNKLLEHAVGKIDVYEKQSSIFSEVIKVFASLSKVNENLSQQLKRGASCGQNEDGIRASKKNKV